MLHYSDRSRSIDFQECPRSFWYGYVFPNGTPVAGIRPDRLNMDLTTGLGFHEGCNHLIEGCSVDEAVGRALEGHGKWEGYWPMVKRLGFFLESNEDAHYVAHEQAAMVEALVRGYSLFGLPEIKERFEIVEAERDEYGIFALAKQPDFNLLWGMRGDALLMDKNTYDLFILSLKTKKEFKGIRDEKKNRYDMQGCSETATVEQRLRKWHEFLTACEPSPDAFAAAEVPEWFKRRFKAGAGPTVMGVKMDFALKGRRAEYPPDSGRWAYSNALIRPWKRDDGLKGSGYAFLYEFKDELGGNHRLGKGWNRINIWEDMGVKEWIGLLATEEYQGLPAMSGIHRQFVFPAEYSRSENEIQDWVESRLHEEMRIYEGVKACVPAIGTKSLKPLLNKHFPKYSNYPTDCTYCPYEDVCHGGIEAFLHDPMSSMKFAPRVANHQAETNEELFKILS